MVFEFKNAKENPESAPLMILIHGFGANRFDLLGLDVLFPDVNMLSLEAPYSMGYNQSYWYEIQWVGDDKIINHKQEEESKQLVIDFINNKLNELDIKFDKDNIYLLGFSQGAILSFGVASDLKNIKRVYAFSGYIDEVITNINGFNNKNLDIFVSHGIYDEVIPIEQARQANEILQKCELNRYKYLEHSGGHWIGQDIIEDIKKWHYND